MAKKFKKAALSTGTRFSPDGKVEITPARLKHWQSEHERMKAAGYEVPIAWDHADTLAKLSPIKKRSAKDTVGFLDKINLAPDGKSVELLLDVTDPRGIEQAESNRVYVSPVILPEWRDGAGNVYRDVITHCDFVNHPVDNVQGKFEPAPAGAIACALRMGLGEPLRMAFGDDDDKDKKDEGSEGESESTATPEAPAESTKPEETNPDMPKDEGGDKTMEAVLAHLGNYGLPLQADTTPENLAERLLGALLVANAAKAKEQEEDKSDEGSNDKNDQGEPVVKDPGYAAMSAFTTQLYQERINADLKALLDSGRCTPAEYQERAKAAGAVKLSLGSDGKPNSGSLEFWISDRKALRENSAYDAPKRMSATVVDAPKFSEEPDEAEVKQIANWALTGQR